jgi:hypothetical protein
MTVEEAIERKVSCDKFAEEPRLAESTPAAGQGAWRSPRLKTAVLAAWLGQCLLLPQRTTVVRLDRPNVPLSAAEPAVPRLPGWPIPGQGRTQDGRTA